MIISENIRCSHFNRIGRFKCFKLVAVHKSSVPSGIPPCVPSHPGTNQRACHHSAQLVIVGHFPGDPSFLFL